MWAPLYPPTLCITCWLIDAVDLSMERCETEIQTGMPAAENRSSSPLLNRASFQVCGGNRGWLYWRG